MKRVLLTIALGFITIGCQEAPENDPIENVLADPKVQLNTKAPIAVIDGLWITNNNYCFNTLDRFKTLTQT